MEFGEQDVRNAAGKILVHSVRLGDGTLRKGHVLGPADIARLEKAGRRKIAVADLEAGDFSEDGAAREIARSLASRSLAATEATTGRANLRAEKAGLLLVNRARIDRLNGIDEAVTLATAAPFAALEAGKIAATVKIVTFGVSPDVVRRWVDVAGRRPPALRLRPFRARRVALVQTFGPKESVLDKARRVMEERLRPLRCELSAERRCAHVAEDIAPILRELGEFDIALVLGSSAIADRRDVVPRAVELAGGVVERLGMPVDPGHLTLLARVGAAKVLGLPGSARSPRLHGSDWILQRLVAGVAVGSDDVRRMGVGGLLKELPGRPAPRDPRVPHRSGPPRVAAVLLAAGQSRRMGRANKMLAEIDGEAMIVRTARALLASRARPVLVVVGHEADRVRRALSGMNVRFVHNPDFAAGLSTSLRAGIQALPEDAAAAIVALGDMPRVASADLDALIDSFDPGNGATICVPTHDGKRGNPVLWGRRYFLEMAAGSGDTGARHLIGQNPDQVVEVARPDPGVLADFDTPEAFGA